MAFFGPRNTVVKPSLPNKAVAEKGVCPKKKPFAYFLLKKSSRRRFVTQVLKPFLKCDEDEAPHHLGWPRLAGP